MTTSAAVRQAEHREVGPRHAWHARDTERVIRELDTSLDGLTDREAAARLHRDGPNRLPPPSVSAAAIAVSQLRHAGVLLLAAAAVVSLAIGQTVQAMAIAAVLAATVGLAVAAAWRARRPTRALYDLAPPRAAVLRQGRLVMVDAASVVQGDVIQFDSGSRVPADARLVQAVELCVLETALTGEPLPVEKTTAPLPAPVQPLGDRANMIHMGTVVVRGSGRGIVTATGASTELGRIVTLVDSIREEDPPFTRRLDTLGGRVAGLSIAFAGAVCLLGLARGLPPAVVLQTAVAFAVAAVPLGLPIVAAAALALGMRRMARRHAVVRTPPAVQALGAATVLCSDTSSTLTSGGMAVSSVWTAGRYYTLGQGDLSLDEPAVGRALEFAVYATRPQPRRDLSGEPAADPVDLAVQAALDGAGVSATSERIFAEHPPAAVLPFCCGRGLMAAFHRRDGRLYAYVKGAPERVMAMSNRMMTADGPGPLNEWRGAELLAANETLARDGLRVLGVATGYVRDASESSLRGLTFEGFLGLAAPPAPGLKATFAGLRDAGLRTVLITGDQRPTAEAIGRQLGLIDARARALDGDDLDTLSADDLAEAVGHVAVFSRTSPEHRLRIVRALRRRGEIVAMLGGGVNDTAALKQADVGIVLAGQAAGAIRESADLIVEDNRVQTVAAAVEEGRVVLRHSRTLAFCLFGCTLAEILVLSLASLAALPLPLQPMHLLWLNLVIATVPALALVLAVAPGDRGQMRRPAHGIDDSILSGPFLIRILVSGAALAAATLAAYAWGLSAHAESAGTLAFMTLGIGQIVFVATARTHSAPSAPARAPVRPATFGAIAAAAAVPVLLATTLDPLAGILALTPLELVEWSVAAAVGVAPVPALRLLSRLLPQAS